MKYIINNKYLDRLSNSWECIKPPFGSLPTFKNEQGKVIVQNINGRYRFDDIDSDRDMISEHE